MDRYRKYYKKDLEGETTLILEVITCLPVHLFRHTRFNFHGVAPKDIY